MSMEKLTERVTRLEERMVNNVRSVEENTLAIRDLTDALNQSKGAYKMLGLVVGTAGAIGALAAWMISKVSVVIGRV